MYVKAMDVTVSLIVLHNKAIGIDEATIIIFCQRSRFMSIATMELITKNEVIILRPLHASATATVMPFRLMTLPSRKTVKPSASSQ
jgi:hypothetical protein